MKNPLESYLTNIENDLRRGIATEYSYRSTFEQLIESLGSGIDATNDPKHIACGAPDFIVERGKVPLGYVETKDIGVDLDKIERTDQMKRYLKALHNLILTDYLEFRWYVNGERKLKVHLAEIGKNNRLIVNPQGANVVEQLFIDFFATETPTVSTPKELAQRLASVTHFIRDQIIAALKSGDPDLQSALEQQYKTFVELLLPALTPSEFADLYAQAITYGLFAAKMSVPEGVTFLFEDAYKYLRGNPFLRRLFLDVNEQLDEIEIIRPYLKDLVSLLNRADFHSILSDFGRRTRIEDPVVHFYETFLATYDPKLRESRGVYYTPEPVVQFIVHSVDELLKTRFNKPWGLADDSVKLLDPACGTGTFLYYVIQQIHTEIVETRKQSGQWKAKSKELLKRIFGFELLIAPYVVSHLKLGLLMETLGAPLESRDDRIHIYLTNTLEEGVSRAETLAGLGHHIAQESSEAAQVKKAGDIMVVLGNPPYSGHSANSSVGKDGKPNFIGKLLREYYFVDSAPLGERNPKWLQDDYVKFIRFGEWRINQTGYGILAFITNHSYLDNPTFRGLRQHLMNTFDEIYVLDLHGNSKKKEKTPDGGKDENVFDIQQGVAILLAVKNPGRVEDIRPAEEMDIYPAPLQATVKHASLWGSRENKYAILHDSALNNIEWTELKPEKPSYLFVLQDVKLLPEYNKSWLVTDIYSVYASTVTTARNDFSMDYEPATLVDRISDLRNFTIEDLTIRQKYGLKDVSYWKLSDARKDVRKITQIESFIKPYCYRPFDFRFVYYHESVCERLRAEVMRHMNFENLAFLTHRPQSPKEFTFAYCTTMISDQCVAANKTEGGGNSFQFPLYVYSTPEETSGTLFAQSETTRHANLSPAFIQALSEKLGLTFVPDGRGDICAGAGRTPSAPTTFGPEDLFYYAYAVFHSPTYRTRYAEFLKIDFPRLPLTGDKTLFAALAEKGKELVELHLLKSPKVEDFITTYPVTGNNKVEKVAFASSNVWINSQQFFGDVPEKVWQFKVGGYQVCEKWLKDRKGRILNAEDISHYQRVVVALNETMRIMSEIDAAIPSWPLT